MCINRFARKVVCTSLILVLTSSGLAAGEAAAEGWQVTPLLPSDALAVVTIHDTQKSIEKFKQTGLWQIYSNPDIQHTFRQPLMMAQLALATAQFQTGVKLQEVLQMFSQGEITIAVLGVDKKTPQNQPIPDLLVSVQAKGKAMQAMDELARRLDQLKAATGGQLMISQTPVGNTTVNKVTLPVPDQPIGQISVYYAQCDGNVVISFGEGRLEKLLAMREKHKGGLQPAAAAEVLGQSAPYQKVTEKAGAETDLTLFLNVEALLKNPVLDAKPKTEQQRMEWQAAGLEGIRAVAYCSGIKDKGIRETFYIDAPAAARKGVLGLIEGDALAPEALAAAPRNSVLAGAIKLTPEKILEKILDIASLQNPNARQDVNTLLMGINQQLGNLDLKKELFNALTGQAVFSISVTTRHPKLPMGFPQPLLAFSVKDQTSIKNLLAALREAAKESWDFSPLQVGEREIITAREKFAQQQPAGQICYVLDKNDLIVSNYPLALRHELARRAPTGNTLEQSLAEDKDFKAARAALRGTPQGMMYIDTGALAVGLYDVFIPLAQIAAPRVPQADITALPTSELLMQNLGGTVMSFSADADGIIAESFSPTGAISLLALIPAAVGGQRLANRGAAVDANAQQQTLEAVARDLKAYAAENAGNYPATLPEMQPKYLAGVEGLDQIVFRGKQDAPNKVVAHSSEKRGGPIVILLQDGQVHPIRRMMLGRVLKDGFTAGAVAPVPDAGGAVKPPKPPEF